MKKLTLVTAMLAPSLLSLSVWAQSPQPQVSPQMQAAVSNSLRQEANIARDIYRHPAETLTFFGIKPTDTVIELWPGGRWYAEILGPYLADEGHYIAANFDANPPADVKTPAYRVRLGKALDQWLVDNKQELGKASAFAFEPPRLASLGEDESADAVLTFRNLHNWAMAEQLETVFDAAYQVLKPGGVLGVVEHRAKPGMSMSSGYMEQEAMVSLAQEAGFTLVASSEVNANTKDTKDHPKGVWTLPPSLSLGEQDREKYLAIGESDRMTLKFIKK
ncbi:methyltransferase domain-containing protein [Shewanella sp. AS1]|uniref:class I SAM-dependent methyltransferase n=1 Tax=Shewanella sp. AS1 TaxID=2907626 RepID=UPI001F296D39|nr:methyltransferase domain-containing protein [Shewanella sp. AS1]MCE9678604.1 methyltransferase domain-containing protein [Shewanella sp. AS1]